MSEDKTEVVAPPEGEKTTEPSENSSSETLNDVCSETEKTTEPPAENDVVETAATATRNQADVTEKTTETTSITTAAAQPHLIAAPTTVVYRPPKVVYKEVPKYPRRRAEDDVEEFDTSEEEDDDEDEKKSGNKEVSGSQQQQRNYSEHITYEGDKCIYTEPGTGRRLVWNRVENKWCPIEQSDSSDPMKSYKYDGKNYVYTDKASNVTYKFVQETNEWVAKDEGEKEGDEMKHKDKDNDKDEDKNKDKEEKEGEEGRVDKAAVYGFENDTHTYTNPSDGTSYFWDREKNAWFPKVDDDFMARYQMSYGFTAASESTDKANPSATPKAEESDEPSKQKPSKEEKKADNKRKTQEPPTWFDQDEAHNTTIYIANLPLDMTMEELKELVTKCGLLARDEKGKDKLKLYTDSEGENKGDARCTYIKIESVQLALNILDGWQIRDHTLSVQRAKFELKGDYNPALKPKKRKKDKDKQKKIHEKLFDWRPDRMRGEPLKCERVVIIKNLFKPEDFDKDVTLLLEYQQDVREECKKCGEVKKVVIYDRHPEGVAQVTFKEVEEAQKCIELLNNRWFGQRRITAETWDGRTKYKIKETEEQIEARINNWDKYLEDKEEADEKAKKKEETGEHSQQKGTAEAV